jgi:hypothetical protein
MQKEFLRYTTGIRDSSVFYTATGWDKAIAKSSVETALLSRAVDI